MTDPRLKAIIDAVVAGTIDGIRLLAAVTAMLVVATALVSLANSLLGWATTPLGTAQQVKDL